MLILTSIRSEVATDEDLKDTSFKNEENDDETNELEIKTEHITVNDHDENEIDIKINNIVDGADVSNSTGCEPAALQITSTKCYQDIQIKSESSFEDTDTRTDILDIDIVKEELNTSTDNQTVVIEDFNKEQDNLNLDISQVTSETTITVSKEIYQDFDDETFQKTHEKHKDIKKTDLKKEPSSRWICKHCNIALTTKARLRLHQNNCKKSATTETRFHCEICKQSFRKQISLKKHKEKGHVNKSNSKIILSEAKNATSDIMKIELSDDDCVDIDNSSDMELLNEDDDIYLVNTIMITPHQKIILPKNVFLSKEALNQFKSVSDKNRIAPLREHNTIKEADELQQHKKVKNEEKDTNDWNSILELPNKLAEEAEEGVSAMTGNSPPPSPFQSEPGAGPNPSQLITKITKVPKKFQKLESGYTCDICKKNFTQKYSLVAHMRVHTGEKPFACDLCEKAYQRGSDLKKHKRKHTGEKPYLCDQCDKVFSDRAVLNRHKRVHSDEKPFACDLCEKTFKWSKNLKNHKMNHTGEKPFLCDQCEKVFSDSSALNLHKRIHTGEKPYSCDLCEKTFAFFTNLSRHKMIHSGDRPHACDQCEKKFKDRSSLTKHKRIHSGEKPYTCDQCDKAFSWKDNLSRHKMMHSDEKPYACDQCEKKFIDRWNLTKHKRIHSSEKPYACDECGRTFSRETYLINHKRIHTSEKPFSCDQCEKSFTHSSTLAVHRRVHAEMKFSCDQCQKKFSNNYRLTIHKMVHTDEKPYFCDQCGKSFSDKVHLTDHKASEH